MSLRTGKLFWSILFYGILHGAISIVNAAVNNSTMTSSTGVCTKDSVVNPFMPHDGQVFFQPPPFAGYPGLPGMYPGFPPYPIAPNFGYPPSFASLPPNPFASPLSASVTPGSSGAIGSLSSQGLASSFGSLNSIGSMNTRAHTNSTEQSLKDHREAVSTQNLDATKVKMNSFQNRISNYSSQSGVNQSRMQSENSDSRMNSSYQNELISSMKNQNEVTSNAIKQLASAITSMNASKAESRSSAFVIKREEFSASIMKSVSSIVSQNITDVSISSNLTSYLKESIQSVIQTHYSSLISKRESKLDYAYSKFLKATTAAIDFSFARLNAEMNGLLFNGDQVKMSMLRKQLYASIQENVRELTASGSCSLDSSQFTRLFEKRVESFYSDQKDFQAIKLKWISGGVSSLYMAHVIEILTSMKVRVEEFLTSSLFVKLRSRFQVPSENEIHLFISQIESLIVSFKKEIKAKKVEKSKTLLSQEVCSNPLTPIIKVPVAPEKSSATSYIGVASTGGGNGVDSMGNIYYANGNVYNPNGVWIGSGYYQGSNGFYDANGQFIQAGSGTFNNSGYASGYGNSNNGYGTSYGYGNGYGNGGYATGYGQSSGSTYQYADSRSSQPSCSTSLAGGMVNIPRSWNPQQSYQTNM